MTEIAVASINRFLSSVYFDAARFKLVPFGDVYKIESYGKPVAPKAISTGERNILALCYFFSEGGRGKFEGLEDSDPQYLVIDDPGPASTWRTGSASVRCCASAFLMCLGQTLKVA